MVGLQEVGGDGNDGDGRVALAQAPAVTGQVTHCGRSRALNLLLDRHLLKASMTRGQVGSGYRLEVGVVVAMQEY